MRWALKLGTARLWDKNAAFCATCRAESLRSGTPSYSTSPPRQGTSPSAARSSVLLPLPLGPISASTCPGANARSTPCSTARPWYPADTLCSSIMGAPSSLPHKQPQENGPPTTLSTVPTGSSNGAAAARAIRSHSVKNAAPPRAEQTSRRRLSPPNTARTACGTSRPTKPTSPQTLTADHRQRGASARNKSRTGRTATPRLCAVSGPSERISSSPAKLTASARLTPMSTAAGPSRAIVTPASPPMRKSAYPSSASGKIVVTASMSAVNRLEIATPARTNVMREAPVASAKTSTSPTPAIAPAKAASGCSAAAGASAQHSVTASPARR